MDFGVIIIILKFAGIDCLCVPRFFRYHDGSHYGSLGCLIIGAGHYAFLYGVVYGQGRHLY